MQEQWTKLSSIVDLSGRIVRLAEQKDWAELARLDRQRRRMLEDIFSSVPVSELDERVKQELQLVAQLNDQALRLCAESRKSLTMDNRKLQRGKEAVAAYRQQQTQYLT